MKDVKYIIMLVLLTGILLAAPSIIRVLEHNSYMPNSEAYYNIRIYNNSSTGYDSLQGHSVPLNIINLIRLNYGVKDVLFRIIPIILGILTVIFSYLILHKQNISEKTIIAIILLMIISPIFNYVFTDYKPYSFAIFLGILGLYFILHDKTLISTAVISIIPFIDLLSGIVMLLLLLTYMFASQKHRETYKTTCIALLAAVILSVIINGYYGYGMAHIFKFDMHNILIDIGSNIGISFSMIILSIIGLILLWEDGWRNVATYAILIAFIVLSLFNDTILIYMNFIIMVYAGFALIYLNKRKWSISIIKKTTILLIVCSIFFSTLVYATRIVRSEPTQNYIDALKFVENQSLTTEVIMASPENGYFIEYYSNRMVLADDLTKYYEKKRYDDLDVIASSRNLDRTEGLLKEYNIKYIIIDKEFSLYLKEKEGLLFLIDTSRKFTSIYKNDDVEVWMYIG